jgi:bifunctional non-homologous end joining protein LigD
VTDDRLEPYRRKRDFRVTSEPPGEGTLVEGAPGDVGPAAEGPSFVVQKHAARSLHYDFRLEVEGVMASWAVPKGPSYDPSVKRLAVQVEDHPLDYRGFEGIIPGGEYGGGRVIVWDAGTYRNITERSGQPVPVREAIEGGHLSVWLEGSKLRGGWALTRTGGQARPNVWILVKRRDAHAQPSLDITTAAPASVQSGRDLDEIEAGANTATWTRARATWQPPMLAGLAKPSTWFTRAGSGWLYERKFDGLRCLAVRNGNDVDLWSRNHKSYTEAFAGIVASLASAAVDNFTLDGELVGFDGADFTGFGALQEPSRSIRTCYCIFDVLHLLGRDTVHLPLEDRKRLVTQIVEPSAELVLVEPLDGEPADLLSRACQQGWEGLVAKRAGSPYTAGRSADWRKLKCSASQELVIGGWTEPRRSRLGFGALLLGYYQGEALRYAGKVGSGFATEVLASLHRELLRLERATSPFADPVRERDAHWVTPTLVADVAFSEWTRDGRLRHPRFEGLRLDKEPTDVVRESAELPRGVT